MMSTIPRERGEEPICNKIQEGKHENQMIRKNNNKKKEKEQMIYFHVKDFKNLLFVSN